MSQFNQLVVACDRDDKIQFAGIEQKFKRPMMIQSAGDSIRSVPSVTLVTQCTMSKAEREANYTRARSEGWSICGEVIAPFALQEFYSFQKQVTKGESLLITLDTIKNSTEIVELKNTKDFTRVMSAERIEFGTDTLLQGIKHAINARMIARNASSYTIQMLGEQIDQNAKDTLHLFIHTRKPKAKIVLQSPGTGYKYEFSIRRKEYVELLKNPMENIAKTVKKFVEQHMEEERTGCKVLLSGELYISQDAVRLLEEELEDHKIYHYKPKEAVALGGALLCKEMLVNNGTYEVNESISYISDKMSENRKLNEKQRKIYWQLLNAIFQGKDEIWINGVNVQPYEAINALRLDFPEVGLLYSYIETSLKNKMLNIRIHYKENGKVIVGRLEDKADEILGKCTKQEKLSDQELFESIYDYLCSHYHYSMEKEKFPAYCYTVETLVRNGGVCKGYALVLIYLSRKIQCLPTGYISGGAGEHPFNGKTGHAWNQAETTNGRIAHVDLTWDLGNYNKRFLYHDDLEIMAHKHFFEKMDYPVCTI